MINQANNIPNGSKVLDVGAGGCPHRKLFSHCEYFTQDFVQLSYKLQTAALKDG